MVQRQHLHGCPPPEPPYDPTNGTISGGDIFRSHSSSEGGNSATYTEKADGTVSIYQIQVAACSTRHDALNVCSNLKNIRQNRHHLTLTIEKSNNGQWYRVKAGHWPNRSEATATLNQIQSLKYRDAYIVTTDISLTKANTWNLPLKKTLYRQALANAPRPSGNIYSIYSTGLRKWADARESTGWASAIPHFAQVINGRTNARTKAETHFILGNIYLKLYMNTPDKIARTKYAEAAIDVLTEYVKKYPHDPHAVAAQMKIADCEFALSKYHPEKLQKAVAAYRKVPPFFMTQHSGLLYANALFLLAENGNETWRKVRSQLTDVETNTGYRDRQRRYSSRAKAMLAETYCFSGDDEPSRGDFHKMKSIAEGALNTSENGGYNDITADVVLNNYLIGRALLEMNNKDDCSAALNQFNTLLTTYPDTCSSDDTTIVRLSRGGALFAKAICLYRLGAPDSECQSIVTQLIRDYSGSLEAKIASTWINTNNLPTAWPKF